MLLHTPLTGARSADPVGFATGASAEGFAAVVTCEVLIADALAAAPADGEARAASSGPSPPSTPPPPPILAPPVKAHGGTGGVAAG